MPTTERPLGRTDARRDDLRFVVKAAFVVAGVAILVLVGWQLTGVALLFFGAVLVATALRSLAGLIERVAPLPSPWSLLVAVLLILAVGTAASVFLGAQLAEQGGRLLSQLPEQIAGLGERFGIPRLDERAAEQAQSFAERGSMLQSVAGYTSGALGALTNLVLVLVGGVYLAARPDFTSRAHSACFRTRSARMSPAPPAMRGGRCGCGCWGSCSPWCWWAGCARSVSGRWVCPRPSCSG